jgi:hypothetical protein
VSSYRKRPVVIEAVEWTNRDGSLAAILALNPMAPITFAADGTAALEIGTLEGTMRADVGDMIVRGMKGEVYPCKPDIFALTYEQADTDPESSPERHIAIEALQCLQLFAERDNDEDTRQFIKRSLAGLNAAFEKEPQ